MCFLSVVCEVTGEKETGESGGGGGDRQLTGRGSLALRSPRLSFAFRSTPRTMSKETLRQLKNALLRLCCRGGVEVPFFSLKRCIISPFIHWKDTSFYPILHWKYTEFFRFSLKRYLNFSILFHWRDTHFSDFALERYWIFQIFHWINTWIFLAFHWKDVVFQKFH